MTDDLKELLQQYGVLTVSLSQLARERPGSQYESLEEHYKSLGGSYFTLRQTRLPPDEHALVVRISKDGETRFLEEGQHDVTFADEEGKKMGVVTVWELPEDEFWFFRAFRPALFGLEKNLPAFLFEMGVTHAYAMFEGYLSEILRARLRQHPRLMGGQRDLKYEQVFAAESRETLIEGMIEREMKELMYLALPDLLRKMRDQMGFKPLSDEHDGQVNYLSLLRNCLLHNRGRVDLKLASYRPALQKGEKIGVSEEDVTSAVNVLRKFAYQIDQAFEAGDPTLAGRVAGQPTPS
ncbi:MAG: hypothetical protein WCA49_13840 [Candidatus Sulfotelmatobacter sp.]